jgi:hypothetical protein
MNNSGIFGLVLVFALRWLTLPVLANHDIATVSITENTIVLRRMSNLNRLLSN